jgi:leader peptidase (prepilin peptidase)/N-methyltransferase
MLEILSYLFFFIFGTIVGSFLNCVIFRLEKEESFLKGKSCCSHCKHYLGWKDLIPILSFVFLRGRCRYCKKKISIQYPLVEFFTGLTFSFVFYFSGFNLQTLFFYLLISSLLILIFVYDLKHYLIPDGILNLAIFLSLFYLLFNFSSLKNLFLSFSPSLFFLFLILISKEKWMGWGDFKLSIFMGFFLGWPKILVALAFSFSLGGTMGIILILLKKKTLKSQVPFAPFLVLGTFFALFFSQNLIDFYLSLF